MVLERSSTVVWHGTAPKGNGAITTLSGALKDAPYAVSARFESKDGRAGTNPEELIAAAHASCFTMALSFQITSAGHEPSVLRTTATVRLEKLDAGWTITGIALDTHGEVPGITAEQFQAFAANAKKGCPISRALAATPISMTAKLG
jgi:osmotically inducible protein OsmC